MIYTCVAPLLCLILARIGSADTFALCEQANLLQYLIEEYGGSDKIDLSSKFLVVQYMTEHIFDYGSYALGCTAWWSKLHGYGLELFTPQRVESVVASANADLLPNQMEQGFDHRWQKVWLLHYCIQRALSQNIDSLEYVVWMDSDLVVLDQAMRLERLCRSFPDADLLVSKDSRPELGLMNSGFMLLKVSQWSLSFLEAWWGAYDLASVSDQGAFGRMWAANSLSVQRHTVLLEPHLLNSEFPAWSTLQDNHQVLHLAGAHDELRTAIFRSILDKLCNKDNEEGGQLLSREDLLRHLRSTRSVMVRQALQTATTSVEDGEVSSSTVDAVRANLQMALQMGYAEREDSERHGREDAESMERGLARQVEEDVVLVVFLWISAHSSPPPLGQESCPTANASFVASFDCARSHLQWGQRHVESLFEALERVAQREVWGSIKPFSFQKEYDETTCVSSVVEARQAAKLMSSRTLTLSPQEEGTYGLATKLFRRVHERLLDLAYILQSLEDTLVSSLPASQGGQQAALTPLSNARSKLLYYIFKSFDMHAAIARRQQWPKERQMLALGGAISLLEALGAHLHAEGRSGPVAFHESTLEAEAPLHLLTSLRHLSDDVKEEAAMNLVELITLSADGVGTMRSPGAPSSVHEEAVEVWQAWTGDLEAALKTPLRNAKIYLLTSLAERHEIAAVALRLLKDVWGERTMPANIELTVRALETQWLTPWK